MTDDTATPSSEDEPEGSSPEDAPADDANEGAHTDGDANEGAHTDGDANESAPTDDDANEGAPTDDDANEGIDAEDETEATEDGFDGLGLIPPLMESIRQLGFEKPTPIQAAAIPVLLEGRDMIGRARTGSGKTAAFGLPLLQVLDRDVAGVQALVLAPTRELALQVTEALRTFARRGGPPVVTIYGGASYTPQLRALREGVPVVVGTPGRVIDHLERGSLDLSNLRLLVLDEADEMLRMGFIDDVERIIEAASPERQVALFSATMPDPIRRVADAHLREPVMVQVEESRLTVDHIEQRWLRVPERYKLEAIARVLAAEERGATLVFARTRANCARLADELNLRGFNCDALHGELGQSARERVLGRMREGLLEILIATDVASRGLDVEHITHVVNFDMPTDAENYVHRIGRTGRAGRKGSAITFVTPGEMGRLRLFGRRIGQQIPQADVPSNADVEKLRQQRLREGLAAALDAPGHTQLRGWIEAVAQDEGWEPADVAAAAIRLLTEPRGELDLDPDPAPPAWAQPPRPYQARPQQGGGRPQQDRRPPPRQAPPRDGPDALQSFSGDEVELFFAAGSERGVRPADIVGALANEAGIPGSAIGRISIHAYKTFAGVPREVADRLLAAGSTFNIRGADVRMAIAHQGAPSGGPRGDDRRGPPKKWKGGKRGGKQHAPKKHRKG
jgi:ATP-dependent RNA helicase DeaD